MEQLKDALEELRLEQARKDECGPFMVASNKLLEQLATVRPDR